MWNSNHQYPLISCHPATPHKLTSLKRKKNINNPFYLLSPVIPQTHIGISIKKCMVNFQLRQPDSMLPVELPHLHPSLDDWHPRVVLLWPDSCTRKNVKTWTNMKHILNDVLSNSVKLLHKWFGSTLAGPTGLIQIRNATDLRSLRFESFVVECIFGTSRSSCCSP